MYNEDLEGTKMRSLLSALTASLPEELGFLYRSLEAHFGAISAAAGTESPDTRARGAAVRAALSAAAVYAEWAPLSALAGLGFQPGRPGGGAGGLLGACCHLLTHPDFRSEACEVVRQVRLRAEPKTLHLVSTKPFTTNPRWCPETPHRSALAA